LSKKCDNIKCKSKNDQANNINWPEEGRFIKNLSLDGLRDKLVNQRDTTYSYILTSINLKDNRFYQYGCGPNFQSEYITLGTCKHFMRAGRAHEDWIGVWIAGFTHSKLQSKKNYLLYLMQVKKAYLSYSQVWGEIGEKTRSIKNARINPYGDIFEPKNEHASPELETIMKDESYELYHEPIFGHKHNNNKDCKVWKKDIYKKYINRKNRPSILIGNPEASFYWDTPTIYYTKRSPRTKKYTNIQNLLGLLKE